MKVADSSVAVAAFSEWHPSHSDAHRALIGGEVGIVSHAAFETYSVLTRLREPHTMSAEVVWTWLDDTFADRWLGLPAGAQRLALGRLQSLGIAGGATYDGLIAVTAAGSGATLVTLDRRALPIYQRVGAAYELVV